MGEEEKIQCDNCTTRKCGDDNCLICYDICALAFSIYPVLTSLFRIDYQSADNIVQTGVQMLIYLLFPFAISLVSLKKSDKFRTISPAVFSFIFVLILIYAVLLLIGFTDGGKLF